MTEPSVSETCRSGSQESEFDRHKATVAGQEIGAALEALGLEFEGRAREKKMATNSATRDQSLKATARRPWAEETPERCRAARAFGTHYFDTLPLAEPFADHPLDPRNPLRTLKCTLFPSDLFLLVRSVSFP